jgi:hypothetical protein
MTTKELWEDFIEIYLIEGEQRKQNSKFHDKQLNKIDVMTAFSLFVNYNSHTCISILKDTQLTSQLWRELNKRYDVTKLYIDEEKLYQLL